MQYSPLTIHQELVVMAAFFSLGEVKEKTNQPMEQ
jgi:hypothetical protein